MNSIKRTFERNKELRSWWKGVATDPRFEEVLLHARASLIDNSTMTIEQLHGAKALEDALSDLAEAEPGDMPIPSPGLIHQRDSIPEILGSLPKRRKEK